MAKFLNSWLTPKTEKCLSLHFDWNTLKRCEFLTGFCSWNSTVSQNVSQTCILTWTVLKLSVKKCRKATCCNNFVTNAAACHEFLINFSSFFVCHRFQKMFNHCMIHNKYRFPIIPLITLNIAGYDLVALLSITV